MRKIMITMAVIMTMALLSACDRPRNENVIHSTRAYDIIKVNDSTLLAVPTGLTLDGDTLKCQKIRI